MTGQEDSPKVGLCRHPLVQLRASVRVYMGLWASVVWLGPHHAGPHRIALPQPPIPRNNFRKQILALTASGKNMPSLQPDPACPAEQQQQQVNIPERPYHPKAPDTPPSPRRNQPVQYRREFKMIVGIWFVCISKFRLDCKTLNSQNSRTQ